MGFYTLFNFLDLSGDNYLKNHFLASCKIEGQNDLVELNAPLISLRGRRKWAV